MGRKQTLACGAGGFPNFAVSPWKTVIFFKALVLGPTFSPTLCVGLNEMQWAALGQECLFVAASRLAAFERSGFKADLHSVRLSHQNPQAGIYSVDTTWMCRSSAYLR
jgi:hypothetical protein